MFQNKIIFRNDLFLFKRPVFELSNQIVNKKI